MAGFSRSARIAAVALLYLPGTLTGQSRVAGRVVRVAGADTVPLSRIPVVLHRVGPSAQGPIDTIRADSRGRFAFVFAADSGAAYLLSARHGGIEYFSSPVATNPARPDTAVVVVVADTSSAALVGLKQRTLLIGLPDQGGTRTVLDWFVLNNASGRTRVAPDSLHPSWGAPLPPEAQAVALADSRMSQFAPDALIFRRDSVMIVAPVSPGDKELMLEYRIPGSLRRFVLPAAGVTDSVFVLLEGGKGSVRTTGFTAIESQSIDGRVFQRWAGTVSGTADIEIALPAAPLAPARLLALLAAVAALTFLGLGARTLRRPDPSAATSSPGGSPFVLADAAAQLDARYAGREAVTPPEEWSRYLGERDRLKTELERALAAGRRRA